MADNDGLLTNEEKNTYEKLIESIDNAGLTNETIHVEAEVTANTEKIDNQFISLNKAIDNTLDTLDRGVNQHKGAFDIWNTFGVELDSSAFGKEDANKDRAEKDTIYDQLSLLAKALNKDPKLLGTLTSLNNKHLKLVVGKEGEKGYLDQAVKVIGLENGIIDKRGYKKKDEDSDVAGFVRLGNSVIASTKRDKYRPDDLNSTLFHEYGHLILQKFLNDIGVEYKDEMTVEEMINKLKGKINYLKKNKDAEYEIEKNSLLDKQLSGKITQEQFNKQSKEIDEIYNTSITKAEALLHVFENIDTRSTSKYAESKVEHHGYINDAHEVFARSFKNYVSGMSNITGGKRVNDTLLDRNYTHSINDERLKSFASLFELMNGENIVASQDMLIKNLGQHKLKKGITSSEIIRIIDNINQNSDFSSALLQLQYVKKMFKENNIDVTDFNYSPFDIEYIMNAWTFGTDAKNERYKNKLYNFFTGDSEEKLNKFKEVEELGKTIGNLPYDNITDKIKNLKNISETLRKIGYDNLSKIDIDTLLEVYNSLDPESKEEFKNLESSLKGALGRIPSGNSDEKIRAEFSDKVKEQCAGFNNFETCIKSLADTFKTQFESAIDNSANAFKLAFESAITSYGDVLARVSSGKNPFTTDNSTGSYKQELIMGEKSSGNQRSWTDRYIDVISENQNASNKFEDIVNEINQYATSEAIKQLTFSQKGNFTKFQKKLNSALSTDDENLKQSIIESYQKDYMQNIMSTLKSSSVVEQTPVVPSGFDVKTWQNEALKQLNQLPENDSKEDYRDKIIDISKQNYSELTGSEFEAAVAEANKFLEDLKTAVANAKPISETVKDTVEETVNSADTVKKTEEIINETVNNTKKTIESGTSDSGKGGNKPPKEPSGYSGEYFIYEKFANTGRDKEYGVGADEFNIKGTDQNKNDIVAKLSPKDTRAIIKPDQNGEWKINLGDEKDPDSLATLKAIMELNETATHILKHMSDFYKFQFNNPSNPEVTPMEWQNINYRFRSQRINDKLFGTSQNQNLGYFSQQYRIGKELRNYSDFLAGGSRADAVITELQGLFEQNQKKIAEANQTGTNPMETLKLLEKQAELKAQLVFRTKELIKAERDVFREQEKQRRKDEKKQKQELTKTGRLQKIERALDAFNDKSVIDANGNVVKNNMFVDYGKAQKIRSMIWSAKDSLKDMTDEEFEKTIADINNAFFEYKEATKAFKTNEKNRVKELNKTTKDIEKRLSDNKNSLSGILGENSTYKDVFGKYGISGLSDRTGKFKLTGEEYNVIHNINKDIESVEKELANVPENDDVTKNKLKEQLEGLNKSLDDYIQNTVAKRAENVASVEDKYKNKVIPTLEHINMMYGHIFDTKADIDYEKIQSGDFKDKIKEWSKFIDIKKITANLFNVNNLKKYSSQFIGNVKQMVGSTVKMFTSAFNKIYGIISKVVKTITIAITGAVATVTAAITGFIASFTAMGKSIVTATDIYRKQTISLVGVYKTPSKSREMINSVYDITRAMPVNYTQAVQTLSEMSAIPALQKILRSPDANKSSQLLTKMFKVITAMTTMRPDQNASGAIFSLRNAFAGDLRSLQRRFDLPVNNIMNSRGTMGLIPVRSDPMAMLDSLENYFDTFLDVETLNKVSDTISVIIEKTQGAFDLFKANIGNSGFYDLVAQDLRKIRDFVINFVTSEDGKLFAKRISDIFSNVYENVKSMVIKTRNIISQIFNTNELSLGNMFVNTLEYFAKIVKYFDEFYNVETIVGYVNELFKTIDSYKPVVYDLLDKAIFCLKEIGSSVLNVSKYVVSTAIDIVNTLKATGLSDKGILFLWLFGPGNVVSLITAGLGALASGIMVAVTAAGLLATSIGTVGATATLVVGAIGALVGIIGVLGIEMATAGEHFAENFKTFFVDVILGGIDKIIYEINNLPKSVKVGIGGLLALNPLTAPAAGIFVADQIGGISDLYLKQKYGEDVAGGINRKISGGAKRMSDNGSPLGSVMYYGGSALSGLISMVKESFSGDNFIMDFAKNGLDAIKTRLGGIATKYTGWKPDDSKTTLENIENILNSILNKINGIELNKYEQPYEARNYEKQIARLSIDLQQLYSQRSGIWNSKSRSDISKKMFTTDYGNFGAEGIQELQTRRLETIESMYQTIAQASNINPEFDPMKWQKLMINMKNLGDEVDKINNYIKDTAIKSVDIIFDSLATKDFKYIQNDVSTYVKAKRQSMDAELMAEITDSLRLQYSVYFATTDEFDKFMDKATEKYHDDFNKLSFDMGFDYIDYTKFEDSLSETGQNIAKELGRRYLAEREYYDNVLTQRNIIESTNKNINKLSLNNLKQNWSSYMNSPYKKVRETAGNVYLDRVKEGFETEDTGSMIRKVRDIAIESFTDMKNSIINAVQDVVKSTQQSLKNGMDKLIADGGTIKGTFKEISENIKKNFFGIYTNKAANDITKFIYGDVGSAEKVDPVVEVNNSIIEGNKNITNKLDAFMTQVKNDASTQLSESNTRQDALIDMFKEVKHGNSIAVTSSKDVEIQQEVTSNPEKYYTTNSVLNPDTLADVSMTIATNWEHAGQCAAGVRAAFDAIVDEKAYKLYTQNGKLSNEKYLAGYGNFGGKRAFGFSSSVINAKDYYDAIKNNTNFNTIDTTGKDIKDILSLLKRGDVLTWKGDVVENGVRSVKQHIGIYQGNGILTSDHVEDLRRKDWIGQRYSKGYGLPQISRLKTELTEIGDALSDINKYNYYQISKPTNISELKDYEYNNRKSQISYDNGMAIVIKYDDISNDDIKKQIRIERQKQIDSIGKISDYDMAKIKSIGYSEFYKDIKFGHELAGPVPLFKADYPKQIENITRTGIDSDIINDKKEEVSYLRGIYEVLYSLVQRGIESNASVYAPVVNNVMSGISTVESLSDKLGGFNMLGMIGSSNTVSGIAKGISGNKYVQLAAKTLPGVGNFVNMLSGEKSLMEYGTEAKKQVKKQPTALKGIWGDLFGTVENVESKFGGGSVGSFLGNMMSGKGIVDSFASANTMGADTFESLAGANSFTKVATGLTSTLFGKSAGSSVAKALTGTKIFGTTLGTALPVVGAVAYGIKKLTKTKDRTAEGKARGAEFTTLRDSLVANRNAMARNYYMANDDTLEALQNYEFGGIRQWDEKRGRWYKGNRRRITRTDATEFTNSMQGYWDLLQRADEENRATQRGLNKLQNTNNMEYLVRTGAYEEKRRSSVEEDLTKYKEAVAKYAGVDTGFKQKLFDGKEYTLTELNDKVNDLIKELGDSKDAIAQNTEAIRQEKLATESAKLDYQTALYGDLDPTIASKNNLQKLQNEWNSIVTETPIIQEYERITGKTWDGSKSIETIKEVIGTVQSVGYTPETKEYWDYMTRLTQANRELKNAQKQQSIDLSTNWISDLRGIAMENGTYDNTQIKQLSKLYGKRENLKVQIQNAVDNMDSALAERLYDESQAITEEIEHYKSSTSFSNAINNAKENLNNIFGNVKENPITSLIDNTNSIVNVIKQSEQWIKDAGYSGYDELDSNVLLPLLNSSFSNVNEMANVFTEGLNSGVFDTTEINPFKDYYNNWISTVESMKTVYRNAVDSGASEAELRILMSEYQNTLKYNMNGMNDEYKKMIKKYQQETSKDYILQSISGFEDYDIANQAMEDFNSAFGEDGLKKLLGVTGNMKEFNSDNIGSWFGVSGDDPWLTSIELQKQRALNKYTQAEKDSEDAYEAQREYWKLAQETAEYLSKKAEETKSKIEDMLDKIEETAKTRVAEEAKSTKGDIVFFDLGSSRDGTQFINNMLDGINANTPETQKLVKTLKQKLMGVRR